jgi:copper resistance protein D
MDAALIAVRFVHFSAAMLLLGVTSFAAAVAAPDLVVLRQRLVRRTILVLVLLLAITGLAWLALEAGEAGAGWSDVLAPSIWFDVLVGTHFGAAWIWHLVLIAILIVALALPQRSALWLQLTGAVLLLVSLGFVGHATMEAGVLGLAHRLNHALHILSAGFWVGSLPPLLFCLLAMGSAALRASAIATLERFSGLGHVAVAAALLTGLVNTQLTLGHLPLDWTSPYQALLAAKLGLVAMMVCIALGNRYWLTPRLAANPAKAERGLVAGTIAEIVLGVAVVGLVSAFATWDPV